MLYLTYTMISSVDLAHYGVSRAKDWVSVDLSYNYCNCDLHQAALYDIFVCFGEQHLIFLNTVNSRYLDFGYLD